jgi:hypothetical protein
MSERVVEVEQQLHREQRETATKFVQAQAQAQAQGNKIPTSSQSLYFPPVFPLYGKGGDRGGDSTLWIRIVPYTLLRQNVFSRNNSGLSVVRNQHPILHFLMPNSYMDTQSHVWEPYSSDSAQVAQNIVEKGNK